jgi:hypothetical protein
MHAAMTTLSRATSGPDRASRTPLVTAHKLAAGTDISCCRHPVTRVTKSFLPGLTRCVRLGMAQMS